MSIVLTVRDRPYSDEIQTVAAADLIGHWPMNELAGSTAYDRSGQGNNGAYTGVTLGQAGTGDGGTCPSFDGSADFNNVFSAALAADFNRLEGTLAAWAKVSGAGVWSDATNRYLVELTADASNRISILRSTTNGVITLAYRGGNVLKQVNSPAQSSVDWLHWALTWSVGGDAVKAYLNGAQIGATQTALTAFAGSLALAVIGAQNLTPIAVWNGTLAHVALWKAALSAVQVAALAIR